MSGNSPQWIWSPTLNQYFHTARGRDGRSYHFLQDGRTMPADEPRNLPSSYSSSTGPGATSSQYTHVPQNVNQLASSMQNLSVAGQEQTPQYQDVQQGFNPQTRVVSRVARTSEGHEVLLGSPGETEQIDESYRRRRDPRNFFKIGKVFYTLWTEPAGADSSSFISRVRFGESVYSQIRRFVVVAENSAHCLAIPITTYGGRGLSKPRVNAHEHSLIFAGSTAPPLQASDAGSLPVAIQVDPSEPGARLDSLSRVNFGKVYTIEHNLKVKPFGVVRNKQELVATFQRVNSRSSLWVLREDAPDLNIPVTGLGRPAVPGSSSNSGSQRPNPSDSGGRQQPSSSRDSQRPAPGEPTRRTSEGSGQQVNDQARALAVQLRNGQISRNEYQRRMAQVTEEARRIVESSRQRQQQTSGAESDDEVSGDDEDQDDDGEEEGAEDEDDEDSDDQAPRGGAARALQSARYQQSRQQS